MITLEIAPRFVALPMCFHASWRAIRSLAGSVFFSRSVSLVRALEGYCYGPSAGDISAESPTSEMQISELYTFDLSYIDMHTYVCMIKLFEYFSMFTFCIVTDYLRIAPRFVALPMCTHASWQALRSLARSARFLPLSISGCAHLKHVLMVTPRGSQRR